MKSESRLITAQRQENTGATTKSGCGQKPAARFDRWNDFIISRERKNASEVFGDLTGGHQFAQNVGDFLVRIRAGKEKAAEAQYERFKFLDWAVKHRLQGKG